MLWKTLLLHKPPASKYMMRICELLIKPKPPMNLAQARIHGLKQRVDTSRQQLKAERDRQKQQRDSEQRRKLSRQASSA